MVNIKHFDEVSVATVVTMIVKHAATVSPVFHPPRPPPYADFKASSSMLDHSRLSWTLNVNFAAERTKNVI